MALGLPRGGARNGRGAESIRRAAASARLARRSARARRARARLPRGGDPAGGAGPPRLRDRADHACLRPLGCDRVSDRVSPTAQSGRVDTPRARHRRARRARRHGVLGAPLPARVHGPAARHRRRIRLAARMGLATHAPSAAAPALPRRAVERSVALGASRLRRGCSRVGRGARDPRPGGADPAAGDRLERLVLPRRSSHGLGSIRDERARRLRLHRAFARRGRETGACIPRLGRRAAPAAQMAARRRRRLLLGAVPDPHGRQRLLRDRLGHQRCRAHGHRRASRRARRRDPQVPALRHRPLDQPDDLLHDRDRAPRRRVRRARRARDAPLPFSSPVGVAAATLAAAALFNPLRRRTQRLVDRRFNRARYDAEATVATFAGRLRDAVDLDTIRAELLDAAGRTLEPSHAFVWMRTDAR